MQWWCVATDLPWTWQWRAYPGVWIVIGLLGGAYLWSVRGEEDRRPLLFGIGLVLLWIALDWPVGALGAGYLASVHMVQFLLIVLMAPPFILMSLPRAFYERLEGRLGTSVLRRVTHPVLVLAVFTVMVGFTHWPPVVDGLMSSQSGNFLLDAMWLATGLLFWWPVVAPVPHRRWLSEPIKMGYLVLATLLNTGVFVALTFTELPLYATFELAPPVGTLTTREDQVIAGLLMKIGGAIILWTAISILFARWFRRETSPDLGPSRSAALGVALALLTSGCGSEAPGDLVSAAVVTVPPVSGGASAFYATLQDVTGSGDVLLGIDVDRGGSLHMTENDAGRMVMLPTDSIVIPPGGTVALRPGGLHGMLVGAGEAVDGDRIVRGVVLTFRKAGRVEVAAEVVSIVELDERFR